MASTAHHIAASSDPDLLARLVAAAQQDHVPNASAWVQANMGMLLSTPVEGNQTIADVRAYAADIRDQAVAALPPAPGMNPAAVTDPQLHTAIEQVLASLAESSPVV